MEAVAITLAAGLYLMIAGCVGAYVEKHGDYSTRDFAPLIALGWPLVFPFWILVLPVKGGFRLMEKFLEWREQPRLPAAKVVKR